MTNGFTVSKQSVTSESNCHSLYYCDENVLDIADLQTKTPFDEVVEREEADVLNINDDQRLAKIEAISGLLGFLFKETKRGHEPTPHETALRLWLLAHTIRPELTGGRSLAQLGELFNTTGQSISNRLIALNEAINIRARCRKTEDARKTYSKLTTERWKKRKECSGIKKEKKTKGDTGIQAANE
jgi:hypothetical protein